MTAGDPTSHGGYTFWVGVCFTVNFILGAGFLGVPFAFVEGERAGRQRRDCLH